MRAAATLLALAACAGPAVQRPAHGSFDDKTKREVWQRAIDACAQRGFEIGFADPSLGVLVTRDHETQAPCGETTCLAREALHLRLEAGHAVASLSRTVWDPVLKAWIPPADPASLRAAEREELAIVRDVADAGYEVRASRKGEPCDGDAECVKGLAGVRRRCGAAEARR